MFGFCVFFSLHGLCVSPTHQHHPFSNSLNHSQPFCTIILDTTYVISDRFAICDDDDDDDVKYEVYLSAVVASCR